MYPNRNSDAGLIRESYCRLILSLVLSFNASMAFGQDSDQQSTEPVFELNPFVVSARETGWDATETLSGSRLRANFDDVASQLEVMTMEFMDDFGLNTVEEAAIYSLSAENSEEYVQTEDGRQNLSGDLRIRGISNATRAREFFATYMAPDNYNLERVTITQGPNAILFGTGSPGGVVNATIARASFEDEFRAKIQFDDWEGERYEFLANRVLVDDVLALKVAGVWEDQRYSVSPASENSKRLYGTLLFKPFKKTSISLHYEDIKVESRRPSRNLAWDRVSVWATSGDLGSIYPNGLIFPNTTGWVTTGRLIIDNRVLGTGSQEPTLLIGPNPAGVPVMQSYFNTVRTKARTDFNFGSNNEPLVDPVAVGRNETTLVDGTYYPTDLNQLFNNEGKLDRERIYNIFFNQEIFRDLFFEAAWQREDYTESSGMWMVDTGATRLQADANLYLPDGVTPNPYAGEFFFEGNGRYDRGERERDEWRLSLAYDFDFTDHFDRGILRALGRHQLSALYNNRQSESISQEYTPRIMPKFNEATGLYYDPLIPNYPYENRTRMLLDSVDPLNLGQGSVRTLQVRNYATNTGEFSIIDPPYDLMSGRPVTFVDANGEEWILDPENAAVGTNGERLTTGRNTVGIKDRIVTHQFAYTGYFLNNRLVYTFGYREDKLDSADEKAPEWTWLNQETGETQSAGLIAHRSLYGYETFGSPEANSDSGITRYHGIVLHPFRGWSWKLPLGADLSLHYSDSNTFQANTPRLDANGRTVPGEQGDGRDIGFSLSLFDGRFFMRYNDFKVNSSPAIGSFNDIRGAVRPTIRNMLYGFGAADPNGDGTPANRDYDEFVSMWTDWPFLDDPSADPRKVYPFWSSENFAAGDFGNELDPYTTISSAVATGREITMGIRPVDNLDIRVTYGEQEVIETDIASNWIEFIDRFIDFMDNSPSTLFVEGYNAGSNQAIFRNPQGYDMDKKDLDPNDGLPAGIDYFRWDQISNGGGENSRSLTSLSMPWGRDDQSVPGGWTTDTMRERFIADAVTSTRGKAFAQSLEGRPNDFVRQKRFNINAMYSFKEGRLNGTSVGLAYRWREAPAVGVVAVPFYLPDGTQDGFVPDPGNWIMGESESYWDLTLAYRGKLKLMNNARYTVRLVIRNLFPDDDLLTPRAIDSFTGEVLQQLRLNDRQFVVSFELKI